MNKTKSFGLRAAAGLLLASALCCSVSAQSASETTGPYKVVMETIPSLPNHTVYRPENLAAVKGKLPIVAFGNGAMPGRGSSVPGMPPMVLPGSVESLGKLHSPTIYIIGGEKDFAFKNAETDFAEIKNVPLFKANLDVGHGGTLVESHGGKFAETATQWLLWQLKGDQKAGQMFVGDNCGLCRQAEWKVERKNLK